MYSSVPLTREPSQSNQPNYNMSDEAALIAKGSITPEEILALTHATTCTP